MKRLRETVPVRSVEASADLRGPLAAAAFGCAGSAPPQLTGPPTVDRLWLAAIGLAARGHYASARTCLREAERRLGVGTLRSSIEVDRAALRVAEASFARQLGGHRAAAGVDGAALVALSSITTRVSPVSPTPAGSAASVSMLSIADHDGSGSVRIDALTGLAADALGTDGPERARRILRRLPDDRSLVDRAVAAAGSVAADTVDADIVDTEGVDGAAESIALCSGHRGPVPGPDSWHRATIRALWVHAETAMMAGDVSSVTFAAAAVLLSGSGPSCRHRVKSALVLAASHTAVGHADRARPLVERVRAQAAAHGFLPLLWAAGMLAPAVGLPAPADAAREPVGAPSGEWSVDALAAELDRRGGRPFGLGDGGAVIAR